MAYRRTPASATRSFFDEHWPAEVRRDPLTYVSLGLFALAAVFCVGLAMVPM